MPIDVTMPHMGESVVEGTILAWMKKPGDAVEEDEPLVEIATDKINVEVPSPAKGVVLEILAEEGATVSVEQKIALIGEPGEKASVAEKPKTAPAPEREKPEPEPPRPADSKKAEESKPAEETPAQPAAARAGTLGVLASPAVRRLARQLGVDLAELTGTGRMGRISKEDVQGHVERKAEREEKATAHPSRAEAQPHVDDEVVPLTSMRRAIAEHMVRSKHEAAHVTTVAEVDMTGVAELRQARREAFEAEGVRLTYMAFILNAVARALKEHPELNASWTDKGILVRYRINLGLAVAVEEGLVVPVIRDVDRLSLLELARAVQDLADKTRQGKVAPADVTGGTFTITNPGVFGAVISTPIIHQPQAAILATGRIADVPAVVRGGIAIRKRMFLSLSYDHRIVDGATAVRFLQRVREILESNDFPAPSD